MSFGTMVPEGFVADAASTRSKTLSPYGTGCFTSIFLRLAVAFCDDTFSCHRVPVGVRERAIKRERRRNGAASEVTEKMCLKRTSFQSRVSPYVWKCGENLSAQCITCKRKSSWFAKTICITTFFPVFGGSAHWMIR